MVFMVFEGILSGHCAWAVDHLLHNWAELRLCSRRPRSAGPERHSRAGSCLPHRGACGKLLAKSLEEPKEPRCTSVLSTPLDVSFPQSVLFRGRA